MINDLCWHLSVTVLTLFSDIMHSTIDGYSILFASLVKRIWNFNRLLMVSDILVRFCRKWRVFNISLQRLRLVVLLRPNYVFTLLCLRIVLSFVWLSAQEWNSLNITSLFENRISVFIFYHVRVLQCSFGD